MTYDGKISISVGKHRKDTSWKNRDILWSDFVEKLTVTHRTPETVKEYSKESKTRQAEIKDIGGFVGGTISGGRRLKGKVTFRSILTLDLDYAEPGFWDKFALFYECAACIYSTHKHTPESPRIRLIIPLDREVFADEYEAIARKVAESLGIDEFDDTTYQPERLMYWPSTSKDGEYEFQVQDGEWLSADEVLSQYKDWHDVSQWPTSSRVSEVIKSEISKQGNPLEKTGVIGAFCRTYTIQEAIDTFLSNEYEACADGKRYTYKMGSTAAGLVIYDDLFAYSHHSTDPCSGKLVNAWDICRIHLFGDLDKDVAEKTNASKYPSFKAMGLMATKDKDVVKTLHTERMESVAEAFKDVDLEDSAGFGSVAGNPVTGEYSDDWVAKLDTTHKGDISPTINNCLLILQNDKYLRGRFAMDKFEKREVALGNLPWRKINGHNRYLTDSDDVQIRHYIETKYGVTSKNCIQDAMVLACEQNSFHPVKDYLDSLAWDGVSRLDRLFIDYLGADDNEYARTVARKMCVAAVARIYTPGCKFDNVVTLIGSQGLGKSTFVSKLGGKWYSDSFGTIQGKEAYEAIQGVWIVEMAEMAGMKKAEKEQTKHFISKKEDRYRVAYGRRTENFPRQCIFIATTNEDDPLDDPTGNRRYWVISCVIKAALKSIFDDLPKEVDQIWAEAVELFNEGESLYLSEGLYKEAQTVQKAHAIKDERARVVYKLLEMPVPPEWESMEHVDRLDYINGGVYSGNPIKKVTPEYIWRYAFRKDITELGRSASRDIKYIMSQIEGWESKVVKFSGISIRGYARLPQKEVTETEN